MNCLPHFLVLAGLRHKRRALLWEEQAICQNIDNYSFSVMQHQENPRIFWKLSKFCCVFTATAQLSFWK